jgi:hypothetical protein
MAADVKSRSDLQTMISFVDDEVIMCLSNSYACDM